MRARTCWPARRLELLTNTLMTWAEAAIDAGVSRCGPAYVVAAAVLIGIVAAVFFAAVIPAVASASGWLPAGCHAAFGLVLLAAVAVNYAACVRTPPGTTSDLPLEVLQAAAEAGRYCHRCGLPKPAGAHHCHICDRCILSMDHHCPWMDTCVGFANYRYFLLTLLYMEVGAIYAAVMTWRRLAAESAASGQPALDAPLPLVFVALLSSSMVFALGLLGGWHAYLVATAQSTIDFYNNMAARSAARQAGKPWSRAHHASALHNFQEVFNVHGRLWWVRWLLPAVASKRGDSLHRWLR